MTTQITHDELIKFCLDAIRDSERWTSSVSNKANIKNAIYHAFERGYIQTQTSKALFDELMEIKVKEALDAARDMKSTPKELEMIEWSMRNARSAKGSLC